MQRTTLTKAKFFLFSALLSAFSAGVARADLMPNFADVPSGWSVDRYAPASFSNVGTYQGMDNVLGIGISSQQDFTNRPAPYQSTFYNTQGEGHAISGGAGSEIDGSLYIPVSWDNSANGTVRTDMWGVMTDASSNVTDYPIIGFTNYGGAARYRVWDENLNSGGGAWVDLSTTVSYDAWTAFSILYTGTDMQFFINGNQVYSYTEDPTTTGFSEVIMQAYNFGGDPSITGATPVDYTAHWANSVPEPGSLTMLGGGLLGLLFAARKRRSAGARV